METLERIEPTAEFAGLATTRQILAAAIGMTSRSRRDFAARAGMPVPNDVFRYLQADGPHVMAENLAKYLRGNNFAFALVCPPYISYKNQLPVTDIIRVGYILSGQPFLNHFAAAANISKPHIKRLWDGTASTTIDHLLQILAANDVPTSLQMTFKG